MRIISLTLSIFIILTCVQGQQKNVNSIIGAWKSIKKELKDGEAGDKMTFDGKPYTPNMKICFDKDSVIVNQGGFEAKLDYVIRDSFLMFGTKKYLIEKLDKDDLVLLEIKTGAFKVEFRRYFKKISDGED